MKLIELMQTEQIKNLAKDFDFYNWYGSFDIDVDTILKSGILKRHKDAVLEFIKTNPKLKPHLVEIIANDGDTIKRVNRNDFDINLLDFDKIIDNLLTQDSEMLNEFEKNARSIILATSAAIINYYGIEALEQISDEIDTEIRCGIFEAELPIRYVYGEEQKQIIHKRVEYYKKYGRESFEYIEDIDILKERLESLKEYANDEELAVIKKTLESVQGIDSKLKAGQDISLENLKSDYLQYINLNKNMIMQRINSGELKLLHYVPNIINGSNFDTEQKAKREEMLKEYIVDYIKEKYDRNIDIEKDAEEIKQIREQYKMSLKYPCDISLRFPLKNIYGRI